MRDVFLYLKWSVRCKKWIRLVEVIFVAEVAVVEEVIVVAVVGHVAVEEIISITEIITAVEHQAHPRRHTPLPIIRSITGCPLSAINGTQAIEPIENR